MRRGRQFYDPEIQANRPVEAPADLARIEFYPELDGSGQIGRWVARRIDHDGRIVGYTNGNFDHDAELAHAMELWPGLTVFELDDAQKDSTWDGTGPSPRIWQTMTAETTETPITSVLEPPDMRLEDLSLPPQQSVPLHVMIAAQSGTYVLLDDIRTLLESWAVAYEVDKNPSAAMALRDAVDALKDIG